MKRYYISFLLSLVLCFPSLAYSAEKIQVLILPFEIFSVQDRSNLKDEISSFLGKQLSESGAKIVKAPEPISYPESTGKIEQIRELGASSGADKVIWGSLTWIGK